MKDILSTLNSVAVKLLGTLSLTQTYTIIIEEALKLSSATYGTIFLEHNGVFDRVYSSLPSNLKIVPRKKGYVYKSFTESKIFIVPRKNIVGIHPEMKTLNTSTLIIIPLTHRGKAIGVLNLHAINEVEFDAKQLEILKIFSSMASLAIQSARSHEETQKALELRDFFIALAGHELRTPLTVINGYAGLLKNKLEKKELIDQKWVTQLVWESNRLTHLVHELLEINQVKTGRLQFDFDHYDLKEVIHASLREFQILYPQRQIVYTNDIKDIKANIIGDNQKLTRVICGLLDNAAKFSEKNKKIAIRLKQIKDYYVIIITDLGKGIKKEDLAHIFEGFYKAQNNTKEGMGLGLFLAQYIIKKHNGSINVQSQFTKGTKVTVVLPKIK